MRTTFGSARLTIREPEAGRPFDVFRIVRTADPLDPAFLDSLRSHYELSEPPRKVERQSTVLHMGISAFLSFEAAAGLARRWPRLGDHIARIRLSEGYGFNFAETGAALHLTVWGDPVKLVEALVDVEPVAR